MTGMNAATGQKLDSIDHLRQSIQDILSTPIGSRVMRRDYGSRLFELVDAPSNAHTIMEIYIATAQAIDDWEPRFKLQSVQVSGVEEGAIHLVLTGIYQSFGQISLQERLSLS